jgi:hypothetical protein
MLPRSLRFLLGGFALGSVIGIVLTVAWIQHFNAASPDMRGEVVELAVYWGLVAGIPTSLAFLPFGMVAMIAPIAWLVLAPAVNGAVLAWLFSLVYPWRLGGTSPNG